MTEPTIAETIALVRFSVSATVLDPEDGESGIVAQALVDGRWRVVILDDGRPNLRTAAAVLRSRRAKYDAMGRERILSEALR